MLNLIPKPKKISELGGLFEKKSIKPTEYKNDERIEKAFKRLDCSNDGAEVVINLSDSMEEQEYSLELSDKVYITAKSEVGIFYAIQTLRQLFDGKEIPKCKIEDKPTYERRGFYHDVTRGKIPKLETLKELVDKCAYFKINTMQLYVEHVYEFKEYKSIHERTGYMTAEETKEIDDYCYENFIELVPSLPTFGHLFELLEIDEFKHLRVLKDYETDSVFWHARMRHHTIDPRLDESFEVVKSLIDQYMPLFRTDKFNICCDETFDLENCGVSHEESGRLYIEFVSKIINYLISKGKKPMMWADILLKYPDTINMLPENMILYNWNYEPGERGDNFKTLAKTGKVIGSCPGTSTWSRFCEDANKAEINICEMAYYGAVHGAKELLNTNWGDHGNVCSLELSMHGLAVGAEEGWTPEKELRDGFDNDVNALVYKSDKGSEFVKKIGDIEKEIPWIAVVDKYSYDVCGDGWSCKMPTAEDVTDAVVKCRELKAEIEADNELKSEYKSEMLIAVDAIRVMSKIFAKLLNTELDDDVNYEQWIEDFSNAWIEKNQENELPEVLKTIRNFE